MAQHVSSVHPSTSSGRRYIFGTYYPLTYRAKPDAPHPSASMPDVQKFIEAYFLYNGFTKPAALRESKRMRVNADGLYRQSRDELTKKYDENGGPL